jgi:hypothetical protein
MFERAREYFKFGAGRPPGTIWAMERAYFEFRRKYPGKDEYAYLRLALESRYPDKPTEQIHTLLSECRSLDDIIVKAVALDFDQSVAIQIRMNVLWSLPACSRCGKYRALSTKDTLCYGCRNYAGFAACSNCRLFWKDSPAFCQRCGGKVWKITDGPGVPILPLGDEPGSPTCTSQNPSQNSSEFAGDRGGEEVDDFVKLVAQIDFLEARCAKAWDASLLQRREYRQPRRIDPNLARESQEGASTAAPDATLVEDVDRFFDALCAAYLGGDSTRRAEIRSLMESNRKLLNSLDNYAARAAKKLGETGNPEHLLRGLAAASIDDGRSCRSYGHALGQLYRNAAQHGLEPSVFFTTVAKLSDNEMRGVLENFQSSEDFSVFVRPYLETK